MRILLICCLTLGALAPLRAFAETKEEIARQKAEGTRPDGEELFDSLKEKLDEHRDKNIEGMKTDASVRFYFYTTMIVLGAICSVLLGYKAHQIGRPVGAWVLIGFLLGPLGFGAWFLWNSAEQMKLEREIAEAAEEAAKPAAKPKTPEELAAQISAKLDPCLPPGSPDDLRARYRALVQARMGNPAAKSIGANDGGLLFLLNLFSGKYGVGALASLARQNDSAAFTQNFQAFIQAQSAAGAKPDERIFFAQECCGVLERHVDWGLLQKYLYECQNNPDTGPLDEFISRGAKKVKA